MTGDYLDYLLRHVRGNESLFDAFERFALQEVLEWTDGSQQEAAELLGISARMVNYRLEKYKARPIDVKREVMGQSVRGGGPHKKQMSFDWGVEP